DPGAEELQQRLGAQRALDGARGGQDDLGAVVVGADLLARLKVLGDVAAAGQRDAAHGVRQVLVEAREEPEAVLSGKVLAASGPGVRHGDAAVLAAPRLAFVDGDLEPALGELLGGGEPAHPAAEHGDAAPGGEPARRGGPDRKSV